MKNRAIETRAAEARSCECDRPLAHRVLEESIPDCLKCGRPIQGGTDAQAELHQRARVFAFRPVAQAAAAAAS